MNMTEKTTRKARRSAVDPGVFLSSGKPSRVQHFSIKEARERISKLVEHFIGDSSGAYTFGRRDAPTALLVSFARFEPLLSDDIRRKLAFLIVDQFLGDAPLHLRKPQIEELSALPKDDLVLLVNVDRLPMAKARQAELEKKLSKPEVLRRLLRRSEIARAISRAREDGLYDAAEHLASSIADAGDEDAVALAAADSGE